MSETGTGTTMARRGAGNSGVPAESRLDAFRRGVETDAAAALVRMVGEEQGRRAAVRVALAFGAAVRAAKDPAALTDCSRDSIVSCIATSAITDLMPGGPAPLCWLVPKAGHLQWWISHRGICTLLLRAGWSCQPVVVHRDEHVDLQWGSVVEHDADPDAWPESLEDVRGVYLVIRRLSDGAELGRPWMPVAAIRRRASMGGGTWRQWPIEMAMKTAIHWAISRGLLPIESPEITVALGAEPSTTEERAPAPGGLRDLVGRSDAATEPGREPRAEPRALPAPPIEAVETPREPVRVVESPPAEARAAEPPPSDARATAASRCLQLGAQLPGDVLAEVCEAVGVDWPPTGRWSRETLQALGTRLRDEVARMQADTHPGREPGEEG